ncbi:MAG: hypothetical protein HYU75_25800 [Betaproteobacteria bacterium]|nr:hypothetical protein [Betaproteobacteria bacterium]
MNRPQAMLLAVAAANLALMLLFPPYDSLGLWRGGTPTFDAFYFAFDRHYNKFVNADMLFIELYWVLAKAALGWLLLRGHRPQAALMSPRNATLAIAAANLVLILLLPPFENYASTTRMAGTWFDGFYFVFGDKWARRFYVPLLYLEVLLVLINTALLWLLFREDKKM